jgi:hypothetical protein
MATKVPCRVLRGSGGSGGAYYWDGVNPMTVVTGGIGGILVNSSLYDLPTVTMTVSDFDAFQDYLLGRKLAFDQLAACAECPGEGVESEAAAAVLADLQDDGG